MSTVTRRRARFHELEVAEVRPLTAESIEVTFAVPPELHGDYDYLPGQYVALRAHVDGREVAPLATPSAARPPPAASASGSSATSAACSRCGRTRT